MSEYLHFGLFEHENSVVKPSYEGRRMDRVELDALACHLPMKLKEFYLLFIFPLIKPPKVSFIAYLCPDSLGIGYSLS